MKKKSCCNADHEHDAGCGCTPPLLVKMVEEAGLELSRRDFIKGAGTVGGLVAFGGLFSTACSDSGPLPEGAMADAIYHGGPIVTMTGEGERAEALAVSSGRILAVGVLAEVMKKKGPETELIDLGGKTLMPGFIDPHSHVALQSVKFFTANLDPKPIGEAGSIADIQRILRDWIEEKHVEPGSWVIGWGYDDTGIEEKRHPNRDDLDAVSTEHPILLMHISSHLMTGNSRMLEAIGVTAATEDPDGGVIQRRPGGSEPNGVLEENAMFMVLDKMPMPTPEKTMRMIEEGLRHYAAAGITTAQDGATFKGTWNLLAAMEEQGKLPIDVVTWPLYKAVDDEAFEAIVARKGGTGRLRLGGIKLLVDGSIQGYTAYLSQPYHVHLDNPAPVADKCDTEPAECMFIGADNHPTGDGSSAVPAEGHRGYAATTQGNLDAWVKRCDENGIQMQVHTNGDAATDMLIEAVKKSRGDNPRPELRTTIIHAQTIRDDQLDASAELGLTPSFFPIHVYFWGDRHRDLFLGPERAARINPAKSALDRQITFTLHHDAPVAGIDMLKVAWAAVNRVTTSGKELGPDQRITPFDAFRAVTADAAWQNFEEARKGTLEVGKLADLVVLSDDPLAIDPMAIQDVRILQTIKEGKAVFTAEG